MFLFEKKKESVGVLGEKMAVKFLRKKKYKILETNFQNTRGKRLGEIDIIAKVKNNRGVWEFVFVEVKTRVVKSDKKDDVFPEENINRQKLYKLQKIAQFYIRENDLWDFAYRFDAVSVILSGDCKKARIRHLKNIFL